MVDPNVALSPAEFGAYASMAGFRGDQIARVYALAKRESGLRPGAWNGDLSTGDQSAGLMQINMIGALGDERAQWLRDMGYDVPTTADAIYLLKTDPLANLKVAYKLSDSGTDFYHWGAYKGNDDFYGTDLAGAYADLAPTGWVSGNAPPSSGSSSGGVPTRGGLIRIPGSDASGTAAAEGDATSPDDPASVIEGWNTTLLQRINALTVTSPEVVQAAKDGGTTPQDALAQIQQTLMAQYASNAATVKSFRDYSSGIYTMPGTNYAVPIDTLPPEVQDAIKQNNDSVYREFLNKSIVDSYNLHADAATAKFNAALSKLNASQTYDTNAVARANAEISRQLGGMAESRSRAQYISDFLAKMAPWTTAPGKSSFTAGDLGMGTLAGMLGIGNAPVVNYTGTQTVDPAALMEGYDSKLGVGGPLPQIPAGITNPDDILGLALNLPDVPDLQMPGAPNFQMPAARTPATVGAPGSSANGVLPTDWSNPSTLFVGGPDPNRGPDPANTPWAVKDDGSGGGGDGLGIGWTLPGDLIQNGLEGIINRFWG